MKGIILAGGRATRLYPITKTTCKQLLPVYDKPMVYYPLSVLMLSGIRDILLISTPQDISRFKDLLGDGRSLGLKISYAVQKKPAGIAQSLIIAQDFIGRESICLMLGDNILYGHSLTEMLSQASSLKQGAFIFGYYVKEPQRYGIIQFDKKGKPVTVKEKPKNPPSNYAVPGIYFYDNRAISIAKSLKPSKRGELEITDVNNAYLKDKEMQVKILGRGYTWLDMGTYDSLIEAAVFIKTIEERQGLKVGCIEEVAYRMGFINKSRLLRLAKSINTSYGRYLERTARDE